MVSVGWRSRDQSWQKEPMVLQSDLHSLASGFSARVSPALKLSRLYEMWLCWAMGVLHLDCSPFPKNNIITLWWYPSCWHSEQRQWWGQGMPGLSFPQKTVLQVGKHGDWPNLSWLRKTFVSDLRHFDRTGWKKMNTVVLCSASSAGRESTANLGDVGLVPFHKPEC